MSEAIKCPSCGQPLELVPLRKAAGLEPAPAKPKRPSVAEVEARLGEDRGLVELSQAGNNGAIEVKLKDVLKREKYKEIAEKLQPFNARWQMGMRKWEI